MDHIAHGQLHNFATDRARDVGDLNDLGRNVARGSVIQNLLSDPLAQSVIQGNTGLHPNKQNNPYVVLPVLPYGNGFQHLFNLLYLAINLSGSDSYTTWV